MLINLKTNLKSLKFGKDRPQEGSSNQPYVTKEIPTGDTPKNAPDFLVRDPLHLIKNTANDVSRLTQMFFDTKSPNGLLFIAKQELLGRTAVATQASVGISTGVGTVPGGIYLPTSTLAQAAVSAEGLHLMKQGINPILGLPGALVTYSDVLDKVKGLNTTEDFSTNRLVRLNYAINNNRAVSNFNNVIKYSLNNGNDLIQYGGGPGSILGVGKTSISFADQRTGANNVKGKDIVAKTYQSRGFGPRDLNDVSVTQNTILGPITNETFLSYNGSSQVNGKNLLGASLNFRKYGFDQPDETLKQWAYEDNKLDDPAGKILIPDINKVYSDKDFTSNTLIDNNGAKTLDWFQTYTLGNASRKGEKLNDFRKELIDSNNITTSTVLSISPSYVAGQGKRIEERVSLGDPGSKNSNTVIGEKTKNIINYGLNATKMEALDKVNALQATTTLDDKTKDLVTFNIKSGGEYLVFRAFLDSFSDSYNATWNEIKYSGRGEKFYNYSGFDRKISLSFTVAAQSKAELIPMYKKLNMLASTLAPNYSQNGLMSGAITRLTVGGYLFEQPGFITSLTYTIPEESPWEIAIDENGDEDTSVKELSHIIKVSSFEFTPIHEFLPRRFTGKHDTPTKFIALKAKSGDNYKDLYTVSSNGG